MARMEDDLTILLGEIPKKDLSKVIEKKREALVCITYLFMPDLLITYVFKSNLFNKCISLV